ncbi:PREDICTED: uncharacterized protein LOC108522515 isoform X3 [Rhinopithecus bieti]|uniref:uncharacterized protein LOC108522515 isoform X3 n=1 Tax=Rhinopithecus bieti TaxID=61621 RepID=UPI00083C5B6A|nr:PREDICTED: uncharacterized protein LOC108522515 isoform X3 [Rhinopithecus bieti]
MRLCRFSLVVTSAGSPPWPPCALSWRFLLCAPGAVMEEVWIPSWRNPHGEEMWKSHMEKEGPIEDRKREGTPAMH